ncbi:MAG: DUF4145 domain-containing protein [Lachnoclostridium sp.]|nr:DUF4145 domain-containing protein [Lachnoclostridium sp.]
MGLNEILLLVGGLAVAAVLAAVILVKTRTAYLGPVKEELQKEKAWLRRGEYNAAMVRGRQNLELLLRLVAEKNGIKLDNSVKESTSKVMTYHRFNRWLADNGYIDRVARWEMNQVRMIGNKAVHENYADKDDAWNQFNYLEDVLKTITERSQNPKKRQEQRKQQDDAKKHTQKNPHKSGQKGAQENPQEQPAKKKKKRRKKSGQSKQNAQEAATVAAAETPKPEQEPAKKKRRRRRKSSGKKAEGTETAVVEKKAEAPVQEKKTPVQEAEAEKKANPHKRRRRRRPRKPQGTQEQNSSGE